MIFGRLEAMEWNHMYSAGGLEDQNPELLMFFDVLHAEKNKRQKKEADEQKKKAEQSRSKGGGRRVAGRRR